MRITPTFIAVMLMLSVSVFAQVAPVPTLMNFQGRLTRSDGTPVPDGNYSIRFSLWTEISGGTEKWNQTINPVTVKNGTFAVLLNTLSGASDKFNNNLYLEIKIGNNSPLAPRQQLVSVAYAMKADRVKDGSITSTSIANGVIDAIHLRPGALETLAWRLGGNTGVTTFLGTKDNNPLNLRVNDRRVMRYLYAEDTTNAAPSLHYRSINILGGADINNMGVGLIGVTIAGGGYDSFSGTDDPNSVQGNFGTVGGGLGNVSYYAATVAGGSDNIASGSYASVGGGFQNTAGNALSVVGGGSVNLALGAASTIGGGILNTALGENATIPGGRDNSAAGKNTFAAGYRAQANHAGSFVWADVREADFTTTAPQQFLIRAAGGVKLDPSTTLELGFGVPDKEANAGKIGYGFLTPNTLDIVGAGSDNGTRKVKIWAEGGTSFSGNINVNGINYTSDERYKTHISSLDNALEDILQLRGVSFEWKRQAFPDRGFVEGRQIGFIAQEVEKVLPELVNTDSNGYKSVAYANIVPILVEALKRQQQQAEADRKRLQAEGKRLNALEVSNASLQAENAELKARMDALTEAITKLQSERK